MQPDRRRFIGMGLPPIPERTNLQKSPPHSSIRPPHSSIRPPHSSIRQRRSRPSLKHLSDTALSPQEQFLHDQLRVALNSNRLPPIDDRRQQQYVRSSQLQMKKIEHKQVQRMVKVSPPRVSSLRKYNLEGILRDRNGFMESYFAEINAKRR